MSRVIHFDLSADDPDRAAKFYSDAFGWQFTKWEGPVDYWLVSTGPEDEEGIDGGLGRRSSSGESVMNTLSVSDADKAMKRVVTAGGEIVSGKRPVPGVGWMFTFRDTEGNLTGAMEFDSDAK